MRAGRLILLAVVALALGVFIMFYERKQPTTEERKEREGKLFEGFDQANARRIVVKNSHGHFELKKENDAWMLTSPLADQANQGAVSSLLYSVSSLKSERTFQAKEVRLADYGLDTPALELNVDDDKGKTLTLKLGGELPLGTNRAVMTSGGQVYLVSKFIASDIDRDLAGWRSDELAQLFAADVASVNIISSGGRVALAHTSSVWTLAEPVSDLADRERAETLISDIAGAKIKEFVDNPGELVEYGLDPARSEVTIIRRGEKAVPIKLAFGNDRDSKDGKQVACRRGERVLWVDAKAFTRFSGPAQEWRAKKLLQFDTWGIEKIELESGGQKALLERKEGMWKAGGKDVEYDPVSRRLTALVDLQVVVFDRPKPTGTPLGRVKLTGGDGAVSEATFYPGASATEAVAVVAGRSGGLAVDAEKVKEVLADPTALTKPKPTPAPPATPKPLAPRAVLPPAKK